MTQLKPRLIVSSPIEGTYAVHTPDEPPVQGVAVYRYSYGLQCESCSRWGRKTVGCYHIRLVEEWEAEHA